MTFEEKQIFFNTARLKAKSKHEYPTTTAYLMEMIFMLLERIDDLEKKQK